MPRKLLALIASALLLTGVLTVVIAPATTLASCANASITVYEDAGGSGDSKTFCHAGVFGSIPNLANVAHTQAGICNSIVHLGDNWNDCISSYRVTIDATHCIVVFQNTNYDYNAPFAQHMIAYNNALFSPAYPNDAISSIRIGIKQGSPQICVAG